MANRQSFMLLFLAILTSIGLYSQPLFAATPGTWDGTAEFGTFDLVVNAQGTAIENITYQFSSWTCGPTTTSGGIGISPGTPWPISGSSFSFTTNLDSDRSITISGTFESSTNASGSWDAVSHGVNCTGSWEASIEGGSIVINSYLSGSWYNASQSGHGFSIEVLDDETVVIYWYVYTPSGHSTFLLGVGSIEGNRVIATTYFYQGMVFGEFDNTNLDEFIWGEITIEFHDCQNATLTYSSTLSYGGVPFGSGTISLTRLLSIQGMQCNENIFAGIYESTHRSDQTGDLHLGTTLLASDGSFVTFSFRDFVSFGSYSVSGRNFEASGTALSADPDTYFASGFSSMGQIQAGHRLNFGYDISGGDGGAGNGWSASSLYRRGISFASISGNWNTQELISGETGSANIDSQGGITGSDNLGCTYSGQITIPDRQFNMIEVTVTVANCGESNGIYSGLGYQTDNTQMGDGGILRVFVGTDVGGSVVDLWR